MQYTRDWTFEDLVKYFAGNRTDAASQVCDKTIRYCLSSPNRSKYPLTPLCSPSSTPTCTTPPSLRRRSKSDPPAPYRSLRLYSETDHNLLDHSELFTKLTTMVAVRCNKCHKYLEEAPDPCLGHDGSQGDARCVLDHHPDPCDYSDKKGKKCAEYGDPNDVDYVPGKELGAKTKQITAASDQVLTDQSNALKDLTKRNAKLEANFDDIQGNVGKLTTDMEKLMHMMASLTKTDPSPSASLKDIGLPPGVQPAPLSSQPPAPPVTGHHPSQVQNTPCGLFGQPLGATAAPQVAGFQPQVSNTTLSQQPGLLAGRVEDLIASNTPAAKAAPNLDGYTGPTIPELRKDQDLAAIVRTELQRIIASDVPSLQKSVQTSVQEQSFIQQKQVSNQQKLAEFRDQQKQQMDQFLANQEQQFQALQQQLGVSSLPSNAPHVPAPATHRHVRPTQHVSDHPAYTALQGAGDNSNLAMDMETLMGLTVRSKQFRPYEFAARTQLFYAKNITERNCNLPCYILGYLRHCLILMSGVVPSSENEVSSRLTNLMNICEIAANNSTLNDFDCSGWQIAKAYGDRVFHDIETGQKTWEDLPVSIMADTFLHAKDTVAMKSRKVQQGSGEKKEEEKKKNKKKSEDSKSRVCTTFNTFRTGDGCAYEYNSDKKCEFEHFCKKCFAKSGKKESHKALNCDTVAPENTD